MPPVRGRPGKIDKDVLKMTLLKYKTEIVDENHKIISKCDTIWCSIAKVLDNIITPNSLYSFVMCNRYGVRDALVGKDNPSNHSRINIGDNEKSDVSITSTALNDSTLGTSSQNNGGVLTFTITMPKSDFQAMIIHKTYRRNEKGRQPTSRDYTTLQPGVWQHFLTEKIWESTKILCGFRFKRNKLLQNGKSGYACGSCKCGATIKCVFDNSNDVATKIMCTFVEGEGGGCGKRYLRRPIRDAIASELEKSGAMKYRVQMAEKLMETDDDREPPHLYSQNVLRVAKHEHKVKNYLHKNPIKALELMKLGPMSNIIHNIGLNPFFVHYWTNFQLNMYRSYSLDEDSCVYIDATGSIIRKIRRSDKSNSKHNIFLYNCVANSVNYKLFPVTQMISEAHNTNAIQYWLLEWTRSGAPRPREVVCDFSRALLAAAIKSFTGYLTIEQYADACMGDTLPTCYIRIDVAHFIKKYVNFLKKLRPNIKRYYLFIIGQLVLCRNVENAEEIIIGLLVISQSETEGETDEENATVCETYKNKFKKLLIDKTINKIYKENVPDCDDFEEERDENDICNKWSQWGNQLNDKAKSLLNKFSNGNRDNAHYMPEFAHYLLKDINVFPLWSCVCRDRFGYGRIPASSASVEGDFNIIKNIMLNSEATPIRVDEFIATHIGFISGRLKLVHGNLKSKQIHNIETVGETECPACKNGHEPTGGHTCYICKKYVHLDECSVSLDEEGYGLKRYMYDM